MKRRAFLRNLASMAGAASLPGALTGCGGKIPYTNNKWNNVVHTAGVDPELILEPASLADLVDVVRQAEAAHSSVRMAGSGHSFSDAAMNHQRMLLPTNLRRFLTLDRTQLRAPFAQDPTLARVESGATVRQINAELWSHELSLGMMGGYDGQTVIGATTTGTHGSSLSYGPTGDQIISYQIVIAGGEVRQVEPSQGITDPARFPGRIESIDGRPVPAVLIQDDDVFRSVAVSMGCLGVVYAIVVKAEPRFWLREVRTTAWWPELSSAGGLIDRIVQGRALDDQDPQPTYYEIYVNPYPDTHGPRQRDHRALVTRRYKLHTAPTNLQPKDLLRGPFGEMADRALTQFTSNGQSLVESMNRAPAAVPDALNLQLDGLVDDSFVARSHQVLHLGPVNEMRAYGVELAFDVRQTKAVIERLFTIAAELRSRNAMHSVPVSLRFVKATDAFLAMQQGRNTLMLEIGVLVGATRGEELLTRYLKQFREEFGARPHWGLDLDSLTSFAQVRALYPDTADRWLAVYRRFNASGVFNGKLTRRLGI